MNGRTRDPMERLLGLGEGGEEGLEGLPHRSSAERMPKVLWEGHPLKHGWC